MSVPTIAPYFPFRRIKIIKQTVLTDINKVYIHTESDKRFNPVCHRCGKKATATHSWTERTIRDLNMAGTLVWIPCRYRKLFCPECGHISADNRKSQTSFICVNCGYNENADFVGAINILRTGNVRIACKVNGALMPSAAGTCL